MSDGPPPMDPHGTLGKTLYVIHTAAKPGVAPERLAAVLPSHLEHQVGIERDGILFAAGPMQTEDGDRRGLIIIRADSFAAAREIAESDPFHAQGLREYTIERWSMNEGGFSVRISCSDQKMSIE